MIPAAAGQTGDLPSHCYQVNNKQKFLVDLSPQPRRTSPVPSSRYFIANSAILLQARGELCCHLVVKIDLEQLVHFLHGKLCEDNNRLDVFISRIITIRPVVSHLLISLNLALQVEEEVEASVSAGTAHTPEMERETETDTIRVIETTTDTPAVDTAV